jgi:hypothetical protein
MAQGKYFCISKTLSEDEEKKVKSLEDINWIGKESNDMYVEMKDKKTTIPKLAKLLGMDKQYIKKITEKVITEVLPKTTTLRGTEFVGRRKRQAQTLVLNRAKRIKLAANEAEDVSSEDELFEHYEQTGQDDNLMDFKLITSRIQKKRQIQVRKKAKLEAEKVIWKPWQQRVIEIIEGPVHPRKVYVVLDPKGGCGKSFLVNTYGILNRRNVLQLNNAKKNDMLYVAAMKGSFDTVFIDCDRCGMNDTKENDVYGAIEALKNGSFISNKYECKQVTNGIPHMFMFTNELPKFNMLSFDRWVVLFIDDDENIIEVDYNNELRNEEGLIENCDVDTMYEIFAKLKK